MTVVSRVDSAGIVTSFGTASWNGSVPVRCRSWTSSVPTIHSCSIGSSLRSVNVTGEPAGTVSASCSNVREADADRVASDRAAAAAGACRRHEQRQQRRSRRAARLTQRRPPRFIRTNARVRRPPASDAQRRQRRATRPTAVESPPSSLPAPSAARPAATRRRLARAATRRPRGRRCMSRAVPSICSFVSHADCGTQPMPSSERRSSSRKSVAGVAVRRANSLARSPGSSAGLSSVSRKTSASTRSSACLPRREDAQRHPRVVGRDREVHGRAVADLPGRARPPPRRRTPPRGRSGCAGRRSRAPPARRARAGSRAPAPRPRRPAPPPLSTVMSSASMRTSCSTSRAVRVGAPRSARAPQAPRRRRRLLLQALQRPGAAALDLRRHARQRDQRAELAAAAQELERRDVVLDAVVVGGERRRAAEVDGGAGSPTTGGEHRRRSARPWSASAVTARRHCQALGAGGCRCQLSGARTLPAPDQPRSDGAQIQRPHRTNSYAALLEGARLAR